MRSAVREALFNVLGPVEGLRVLDVFAGSGSLGFEALSRGAAHVTFVERAAPCLKVLAENAGLLGAEDRVRILRHDLARGLPREPRHAECGGGIAIQTRAHLARPQRLRAERLRGEER